MAGGRKQAGAEPGAGQYGEAAEWRGKLESVTSQPTVWVGEWLRATNIDELPQLINVFLGQMSIVGPRPSPFRENQICVPWRRARLSIRPGVTGLWQICRSDRDGGNFHQWIYYDVLYVRHRSVWLDAKILLATILTLGGRKSVPCRWLTGSRAVEGQAPGPRRKPSEPLFYAETS